MECPVRPWEMTQLIYADIRVFARSCSRTPTCSGALASIRNGAKQQGIFSVSSFFFLFFCDVLIILPMETSESLVVTIQLSCLRKFDNGFGAMAAFGGVLGMAKTHF